MPPAELAQLLDLPAEERAELAIVLWESLTDREREAQFKLGSDERAELDKRWAEHLAQPQSAVSWAELRRRLFN